MIAMRDRALNGGTEEEEPKDIFAQMMTKKKGKKGGKDGDAKDPVEFKMKFKGDFMKPQIPFFDPQAMVPPMSEKMLEKVETKIYKEVEIAMK